MACMRREKTPSPRSSKSAEQRRRSKHNLPMNFTQSDWNVQKSSMSFSRHITDYYESFILF